MAIDMFLKIDGIPGESRDDKQKNEIDLISWEWEMTQSGTMHEGGGGGGGKVSVSDLTLTKKVDKATTAIMSHCCSGKHIKQVDLYVRKAGGDAQVEYLKIKMEEVIVTSYRTGGNKDELDRILEHVSLNFAKYVTTYTEQTKEGTAGPSSEQGWNMAENKKNP
jgi:type VI secretion system secreted protein Hcp